MVFFWRLGDCSQKEAGVRREPSHCFLRVATKCLHKRKGTIIMILEGWITLSWKGRYNHVHAIRDYMDAGPQPYEGPWLIAQHTSHRPGVGQCTFLVITIISCIVSRSWKVRTCGICSNGGQGKRENIGMKYVTQFKGAYGNYERFLPSMTAHTWYLFMFLWFNFFLSVSQHTLEVPRCGIPMVAGFWAKDRM